MKFDDKALEIVVKANKNGDFSVESNSRESYRVYHALRAIVNSMGREINRQRGKLVLANNHTDRFERSVS